MFERSKSDLDPKVDEEENCGEANRVSSGKQVVFGLGFSEFWKFHGLAS